MNAVEGGRKVYLLRICVSSTPMHAVASKHKAI